MPYGKSEDINMLKKKVQEKLPGVDMDNLSQNDMKDMLMNEISKSNIDPKVKEKINKGDIDGLKEDLINYLSHNKGGDSEKLANMLKNNDMEGLKNQLMGMLLGGIDSQKKKGIDDENSDEIRTEPDVFTPALLDNNGLLNAIMGKAFEGNKKDKRVMFLNSMKPFISEKRQKSIDDCIKIISLMALFDGFTNKVGS